MEYEISQIIKTLQYVPVIRPAHSGDQQSVIHKKYHHPSDQTVHGRRPVTEYPVAREAFPFPKLEKSVGNGFIGFLKPAG
jgi:hypothetical protein